MQGSSSSGGPEGHSKRKTAQPTGKKDGKSNSSKQSSKSQDVGSQSSDVNQQIKEKNSGKYHRLNENLFLNLCAENTLFNLNVMGLTEK